MTDPSIVRFERWTPFAGDSTATMATMGCALSKSVALTVAVVGWMIAIPCPVSVKFDVAIVTCSAYVPAQTTILSPALAALTADWIVP